MKICGTSSTGPLKIWKIKSICSFNQVKMKINLMDFGFVFVSILLAGLVWLLVMQVHADSLEQKDLALCTAFAKQDFSGTGAVCGTDWDCWRFERKCWKNYGIRGPVSVNEAYEIIDSFEA